MEVLCNGYVVGYAPLEYRPELWTGPSPDDAPLRIEVQPHELGKLPGIEWYEYAVNHLQQVFQSMEKEEEDA